MSVSQRSAVSGVRGANVYKKLSSAPHTLYLCVFNTEQYRIYCRHQYRYVREKLRTSEFFWFYWCKRELLFYQYFFLYFLFFLTGDTLTWDPRGPHIISHVTHKNKNGHFSLKSCERDRIINLKKNLQKLFSKNSNNFKSSKNKINIIKILCFHEIKTINWK